MPAGWTACRFRELEKSGKIKTSDDLEYKKNDWRFIKQVDVYVTNILTEINLIFTFYSCYWLTLPPVMVF